MTDEGMQLSHLKQLFSSSEVYHPCDRLLELLVEEAVQAGHETAVRVADYLLDIATKVKTVRDTLIVSSY